MATFKNLFLNNDFLKFKKNNIFSVFNAETSHSYFSYTNKMKFAFLSFSEFNQSPSNHHRASTKKAMSKAKRNLTKMIITINIIFVISNLSATLSYMSLLVFGPSALRTNILSIISYIILFATHSTNLFVYLCFDKQFTLAFIRVFSNILPKKMKLFQK